MKNCKSLIAAIPVQSPDNGPALPGSNNAYMVNEGEAIGRTLKQTTATAGGWQFAILLKRRSP